MTSTPTPSTWPHVTSTLNPDGTGHVTISGNTTPVSGGSVEDARHQVLSLITATASSLGRPVRAEVTDPDGAWALIIHPDGMVHEDPASPRKRNRAARPIAPTAVPAPTPAPRSPLAPATVEPVAAWEQDENLPATDEAPWTPRTEHVSPLEPAAEAHEPEWTARAAEPAQEGVRGRFNRILGARVGPSSSELVHRREAFDADRTERERRRIADAEASEMESRHAARRRASDERAREQRRLIQTNFQGTRTIVIANPKGGARKTTTAYLLAATFGIIRGGSVVAWDANETMGTLGQRAYVDTHSRTVVDLIEDAADEFDSIKSSRIGRLDGFLRQQGDSHFDVLASDEDPTRQDIVDADGFNTVHEILSRFKRMILVDTGNNIRASHFQAALSAADQLVVPVAASHDSADVARQMLRSLRASGHQELADNAIVLIHDLEPANSSPEYFDVARSIAAGFEDEAAAVVPIPFDPALKDGGRIEYVDLAGATRSAYQDAAAAVSDNLAARARRGL